jgi:hypothetical protein
MEKKYFKLKPKVGSHSEKNDEGHIEVYKASEGRVIETEKDLVAMFPEKFERVKGFDDADTPEKTDVSEAAEAGAADIAPPAPTPVPEAPVESPLGKDRTDKFSHAKENDFKVFSDGGAFYVTDVDDIEKALNDKPLKRQQVDSFVDEYLST